MMRPCGVFNVDYHQDRAIVRTPLQWAMLLIFLGFMLFLFPRVFPRVYVSLVTYMGIFVIAVVLLLPDGLTGLFRRKRESADA